MLLNLKDIIKAFIEFREEIIRRRTIFELNILCNSQSEAKKIAESWKANANKYYADILKMFEN